MATEKRLIEANGKYTINAVDLTGFILSFSDGIISVVDRFGHVACEFYTDDIPAVDAVEVVRGRWLTLEEYAEKISADPTGYAGGWRFCSECEQPMRELYGWAYCPNCGAKMDGDGNG